MYDLAVAYRICPVVSRPALGLPLSDDKYRLSELCLRSFKDSLGPLRVKVWVILDGCPPSYSRMFRHYFADEDLVLIPHDTIGNRATFNRQLDVLLEQKDASVVYFAEDDYFYLPGQFSSMIEYLKGHTDADFISPYDHLDCYTLDLHDRPKRIRPHKQHHWRTAASTCLTFLAKQETLAASECVFRSYVRGNDDCAVWLSLTKERVFDPFAAVRYFSKGEFYWKIIAKSWLYCWKQILFGNRFNLWIPIPGIATHLNKDALSPTIDWIKLIEQQPAVGDWDESRVLATHGQTIDSTRGILRS
jgi:hypothetical protein